MLHRKPIMVAISEPSWCVAQIKSGTEFNFETKIQESSLGIRAYVPISWVEKFIKRAHRTVRWRVPIFRSYVFLRNDEDEKLDEDGLRRIPLEFRLMRADSFHRSHISNLEMERVMKMERDGEFDGINEGINITFKNGAAVVVNQGVFAGVKGRVVNGGEKGGKFALVAVGDKKVKIPLFFLKNLAQG